VFDLGRPFQSSTMFVGKAGAYPSEATDKCHINIKLGWKSWPGTNILAYCEH